MIGHAVSRFGEIPRRVTLATDATTAAVQSNRTWIFFGTRMVNPRIWGRG
jgi:hypothetical protein